ncbi:MAG: three-Cys-motif partner protein TcmP [Chloroflexi bacterium]|nr:three-Cys-motif partner protein TcmP [Chloroflexota bacterium]
MTQKPLQQFGGDWSADKLERVRKYLGAYTTILSKYPYRIAYIDAFAGTGYQILKSDERADQLLFPELAEQEPQTFLDGSARMALQVRPRFTKYIFIEQDQNRFAELEKLKTDFPSMSEDIILKQDDCNAYLQRICRNHTFWVKRRAVLFLDPFGMQVQWKTIEAIASTEAIDLWVLFPLGVAVNRVLRRDAHIGDKWRQRLDDLFGTPDWYDQFYQPRTRQTLFGEETTTEKVGNFDAIGHFFINRLKTVVAGGVEKPLFLRNTRNNPLYMLCFAAGHTRGARTAIKIASDILGK